MHAKPSKKSTQQRYGPRKALQGVQLIELTRHVDEGGSLLELVRFKAGRVETLPGFEVAQINFSELEPGAIKAWHLHKRQDDVWFAAPQDRFLVGLWDLRDGSATRDEAQRVLLGGGHSRLLFVPRGVAHGVANLAATRGHLLYLLNQQFDRDDPDEFRLPWDARGPDFWRPQPG